MISSSQSSVAEWESAKSSPRVATLVRLARALGVTIKDLSPETHTPIIDYPVSQSALSLIGSAGLKYAPDDGWKAVYYVDVFDRISAIIRDNPARLRMPAVVISYLQGLDNLDHLHAAVLITHQLWESAQQDQENHERGFAEAVGFQIGFFAGIMSGKPPSVKPETD